MNAAEMYAHLRQTLQGEWTFADDPFFGRTRALSLFTQGLREANRVNSAALAESRIDSTGGATDFLYATPIGIENRDVRIIQVIDGEGNASTPLRAISAERAAELFGDFNNASGTTGAVYWWPAAGGGKIGIGPPIGEAVTGGIKILHLKIPKALTRIHSSDNGDQATFTINSEAVLFTAGFRPAEGEIQDGDEIGVGTDSAPPSRWYVIKTVTNAGGEAVSCVLREPYEEPSIVNAGIVAGQRPELLESADSETPAWAAIHYAIWRGMTKSDPELAERHRQLFEIQIEETYPSTRGRIGRERTPSAEFGWMSR